jgi:hypothetical protein
MPASRHRSDQLSQSELRISDMLMFITIFLWVISSTLGHLHLPISFLSLRWQSMPFSATSTRMGGTELNLILLVMRETYPQSTLSVEFEAVGRKYFVGEISQKSTNSKFRRLGAAANKE